MLTFPHIGPVYLSAALALKELGLPFVIPPANTIETLDRGKSVSPEEMCLPFKFMAGNIIQAYEKGAGTVIMPATMGPCRLGEYGELLKQILDGAGYKMEWILIDTPKAIGRIEWVKRLKQAGRGRKTGLAKTIFILLQTVRFADRLDSLEAQLKKKAGCVEEPGRCVRMLRSLRSELWRKKTFAEAYAVLEKYEKDMKRMVLHSRPNPVRILITGEIYTVIESAANQNLEEQLMLLGCEVRRPLTVSWWLRHTIKQSLPGKEKTHSCYLPYSIGGYACETVEEIENAQEDGIIKIMPSGCMPEIVAKAASNVIEEEKGKKVLHLIFDEMQGKAGYETRVEAFVDMLERRKCALSGS